MKLKIGTVYKCSRFAFARFVCLGYYHKYARMRKANGTDVHLTKVFDSYSEVCQLDK